jgi:undecaprenyl-diphosphatase
MLAGALAAALAGLGFLKLASEVREGDTLALDTRILLLFRRAGDHSQTVLAPWVTEVARDLSALGGPTVSLLVVAAVAGYFAIYRRWLQMGTVLAAALGGALLAAVLKLAFARPRPDLSLHLMPATSPGFPSGHSMESAVIYLTLGAMVARVMPSNRGRIYFMVVAMAATILVGVSRVYLGVHYPSDVLAGWSAGLAWALLCWLAARRILERRRLASALSAPPNAGDRS